MSKKIISFILCLSLVFGTFAIGGVAASAQDAAEPAEGNREEIPAEPKVDDISGLIESVELPEDFSNGYIAVFSNNIVQFDGGLYYPDEIYIKFKGGTVAVVENEFEDKLLSAEYNPYFRGSFRLPGESEDVSHVVVAFYAYYGENDIRFCVCLDEGQLIYEEEAVVMSLLPVDLLVLLARITSGLRSNGAESASENFSEIKSLFEEFAAYRKTVAENNSYFVSGMSKIFFKIIFTDTLLMDIINYVKSSPAKQ